MFKYNIANYEIFQKYGKLVAKARNKLRNLGNLLFELAVIFTFFDEFNIFYQVKKDIYLRNYSKNNVNKDKKIIIPIRKKNFKLLINKESKAKV